MCKINRRRIEVFMHILRYIYTSQQKPHRCAVLRPELRHAVSRCRTVQPHTGRCAPYCAALLFSVFSTALRIAVCNSSGRELTPSAIPQIGQISVSLSLRDNAGGAVYVLPHFGHVRSVCFSIISPPYRCAQRHRTEFPGQSRRFCIPSDTHKGSCCSAVRACAPHA